MKNGWDLAEATRLVRGSSISRIFEATIGRIEAAAHHARAVRFCRERARDFSELPGRHRGQLVIAFIVAAVLAQLVLRIVLPSRLLPALPQLVSLDVLFGGLATLLWIVRNGSRVTFEESQRKGDGLPRESA